MKVLIFGGTGLLGSELKETLIKSKVEVYCPTRADFNLSNTESIKGIINQDFDFVVNCLAEISVEKCEDNPSLAYSANAAFPIKVLECIKGGQTKFIHISTSDVFNDSSSFIRDTDTPNPVNVYGKSKYLGERMVTDFCSKNEVNYNIIRIGWMYGKQKAHFVSKVKDSLLLNKPIEVINDQFNIPIYNKEFAESLYRIIYYGKTNNKTLHFSSYPPEKISKFDIALEICSELKQDKALIIPKSKNDIFKVPRPGNVCLRPSHELTCNYWKESLLNYLRNE